MTKSRILSPRYYEANLLEPTLKDIQLKYLANKALLKYRLVAEGYFNRQFPTPEISFKLRGKSAGKAYLQKGEIRLNPILFKENRQIFLDEVIPHELAHLIAYQLFGKVQPHGKEWQHIMQDTFSLQPSTTHSLDITSVQGKTFEYQCLCQVHPLTIRRHNKVQTNKALYSCRQCNSTLHYTGNQSI